MAKQKKKRNKRYTGAGAAMARPSITRIEAVHRSKPQQWWFDNKRIAKPVAIAGGIATAGGVIIYELVRLFT